MIETTTDIDWAAMKLRPHDTGLPMAVWITENDSYPHDVRVKVSPLHGGRGSWHNAPSIGVRPQPHEIIVGSLTASDVALVARWVELNWHVIIDLWDGTIGVHEVAAGLRKILSPPDAGVGVQSIRVPGGPRYQ